MEYKTLKTQMGEHEEFAEALLDQLSVETGEEEEIMRAAENAAHDMQGVYFEELEQATARIFPEMKEKAESFLDVEIRDDLRMEFPELSALKKIKAEKVFSDPESRMFVQRLFGAVASQNIGEIAGMVGESPAKYLVYSTYAIQYLSKISTTYGDYMDPAIYLNKFTLSRYPQIILHKQGAPYAERFPVVNSGYIGAIKMTVLEETIHSAQRNLQEMNRNAAMQVNQINEELAGTVLEMDPGTVSSLSEYLQLQAVPDDFPFAKRANLFFFLNPDHFLVEQIGPDVMTFTHVEIDSRIAQAVPQLLGIYRRWLEPIQRHHAAFSTMEGMAAFAVESILGGDRDFESYLSTFMGTDFSSYQVRKDIGRDFTKTVHERLGAGAFKKMIADPPSTRELKDPQTYLGRAGA